MRCCSGLRVAGWGDRLLGSGYEWLCKCWYLLVLLQMAVLVNK